MRALLTISAMIAALAAAPASAGPAPSMTSPPATGTGPAQTLRGMDDKAMHEMCKTIMGKEMANKPVHEHSREKGGIAMWPNGKPLTQQEMAEAHRTCIARMQADGERRKD